MHILISVLLLSIGTAFAGLSKPAAITDVKDLQEALTTADKVEVYEGLPHQMFDADLLKKELKRKDIIKIGEYPFYSPAKTAMNSSDLRAVLSSSKSILPFSGEKLCGGFHPDYCVAWTRENQISHALICFGCHEIYFLSNDKSYRYDLTNEACENLMKLLSPYGEKRPPQQ